MKKNILSAVFICCLAILTGCEYDNYDEPESTLSGKVVYEGQPIGVRTNGIGLELWQDGYAKKISIPVYIAHDGTYSVSLFDGQYKLVRKAGAPWQDQLNDTIIINVKNNTTFDIPVTPYYTILGDNLQIGSGKITAKFTVNKIIESANINSVRIFFGKSILTDNNKKEDAFAANLADINIGKESSITADIPASLVNEDYIFVRVGIRATASNEFYYTQVQKVNLK